MEANRAERVAIIDAYLKLLEKGHCDGSPKIPCLEKELSEWFFRYIDERSMWPKFRYLAMRRGLVRPW